MNELLQKLLESEILTEDTKKELEGAIKIKLDEATKAAKEEVEKDVRAQLAEQWITERNMLVESIDAKVSDFLAAELVELKSDISRFRDLEVEYSQKLVTEKASMTRTIRKDMSELVDKLDSFLEIRLNNEIGQLKESIQEIRKNSFGRKIFEAYQAEFAKSYNDKDGTAASLREAETKLEATLKTLSESQKKLDNYERSTALREVLAPLSGRSKEIMAAILKNVATKDLSEGYRTFIGRVLKETTTEEVKPATKLTEDTKPVVKPAAPAKIVTGDTTAATKPVINEALERYKKLAGI